ncbi:hypothetical protein IGI04_005381 [Brassica rapa subsp. trilocularis]|uniref:Nucleoporin NSP1-like C-terminal domain-containing protein n=1 Tax=Brassica rapa subsp. trilocularis TaxID=1813537 RepID=A0ABQ7NDU2_BRACM|nr:hypothetical protein IGI04_005381 [Brassica rapa subsp. trilocularis]
MELRRWPWEEMTTMAVGRDEDDGRGKRWSSDDGRWMSFSSFSFHHRRWPFDVRQATMLLDDVFSASSSSASVSAPSPFGAAPASGSAPLFGSSSSLFSAPSSAAGSSSPLFATSSSSATTTQTSLVVASTTGTSTTVAAPVAGAPKLPSEITGKTVEEEWNTELEERTGSFRKQANAIAEWDKRILQNRDVFLRLEEEVDTIIPNIPRDGPRRLVKNAVRDWSATFRTASRAGQVRRVPPKDKPAAVRDGTGRESPIDISIGIVKN